MTPKQRIQAVSSRTNWFQFWVLTAGLVLVLLSWGIHAGFHALGHPLKDPFKPPPDNIVPFWKVWEVSSVVVTLVITIVYWVTFFVGKRGKDPGFQGADVRKMAPWILWLAVFVLAFVFAGVCAWFELWIHVHIGSLALGLIAAVKLGKHAMVSIHSALEQRAKALRSNNDSDIKETIAWYAHDQVRLRDNISKYRCFSDVPIAVAMTVLAVLISVYHFFDGAGQDMEVETRAFIAGAVALQLLYSNIVWWVEAFADTPFGRKKLDRLTTALQPIRRMLHPEEIPGGVNVIEWAEAEFNRLFPEENGAGTI